MKNLELYIHIPFCVKKCDYCDFLSGAYSQQIQKEYVMALCNEIAYMGRQLSDYTVRTIFIGGGTPSWLDEDEMEQVMQQVHQCFRIDDQAEISIECNPGTVTRQKFITYRRIGINRISIGLQSANDDELQMLGRIHTYEKFLHTYELARECGFADINIDIMTGLPGQTLDKLHHTLQQIIRLRPEHISAYALMIEKGTPFYDRYKFDDVKQHAGMQTEFLPDEDLEYQLYKMTQHTLKEHGYLQYEISNYAREGHACLHNIGYWKRENYLGVGIGAASLIEEVRYSNMTDIYEYMERAAGLENELSLDFKRMESSTEEITEETKKLYSPLWASEEPIDRKSAMEEFMFLGLRMNEGVTREAFQNKFQVPIDGIYGEVIQKLKEEELLETIGGRIRLTDKGADLSNYALAEFLLDD